MLATYFPKAPYMLAANTAYLAMNLTKKPLDDPAFRKALAFAIDVPSIVKHAYANLVNASTPGGLLPALNQYDDTAVQASLGYPFRYRKGQANAGRRRLQGRGCRRLCRRIQMVPRSNCK